jgi:Transposase DDE domain
MSIQEILSAIFANIGLTKKPEVKFFTEIFTLLFSVKGRHNFENWARYSFYDESTFRRHFGRYFDWVKFNQATMELGGMTATESQPVIAAIDCSFISKSGKKTFGLDSFWSGCLQKAQKGLEISVIALINVKTRMAWTLDATQTPSGLSKQESDTNYSRVDFYIEQIMDCLPYLIGIEYFVADGYYAKAKIFAAMLKMNKHIMTKLRSDANLKFRFEGEHPNRRGPKNKYGAKVTYNDLSLWKKAGKDEKYDYLELYYHVCYSPSFDCWLMVVLIYNTKTKQYALLASTDLEQSAQQILTYYQLRFQIEFIFRDAKQYTGLTHCQAQSDEKLDFHFNLSLAALNVVNVQKTLDPNALSINNLARRSYNERLLQNLLTKLSKKADLNIFINPIQELVHSAAKWGEMNIT